MVIWKELLDYADFVTGLIEQHEKTACFLNSKL